MSHFLIVQHHLEDDALESEIIQADTWQTALAMQGLGWALADGNNTLEQALTELKTDGTEVQIKEVYVVQDSYIPRMRDVQ